MKIQLSYKAIVDEFTIIERNILFGADSLRSVEESKDALVQRELRKEFPGKKYDLLFSVVEAVGSAPVVRTPAVAKQPKVQKTSRSPKKENRLTTEIWNGLDTRRKHPQYGQLKQTVLFETFDTFANRSDSFKDLVVAWREAKYHTDERPCLFIPDAVPATLDNIEFVTRREINRRNGARGKTQRMAGLSQYYVDVRNGVRVPKPKRRRKTNHGL